MTDLKKGDLVIVKARTWSDYIDNHIQMFGRPEERGGLVEDVTLWFDPRASENVHAYMEKKAEETKNWRAMIRRELPEPLLCLVVGFTVRQTGYRGETTDGGWEEGYHHTYGYLTAVKVHKVVMVVPYERQQYSTPFSCIAEDLEKI